MNNMDELIKSLDKNAPEYKIKERRKGADIVIKTINFIGYSIWAIIVIIIAIIERAGTTPYILKNLSKANAQYWDEHLLNIALGFTVVLFIVCAACVVISLKRIRRRTDKIKTSLFIGELITFVIGIFLMLKLY
jgi:predicted membrane channel-forming protein YqfA (hemolysin III family)